MSNEDKKLYVDCITHCLQPRGVAIIFCAYLDMHIWYELFVNSNNFTVSKCPYLIINHHECNFL